MGELEFALVMGETAVATGGEVPIGEAMKVYERRFLDWPIDDFKTSMKVCSESSNRFPTFGDILKNRPNRFITAADVLEKRKSPFVPLISVDETDQERGKQSIEDKIDSMTKQELIDLFVQKGGHSPGGAIFSAKEFLKNTNGRMYRSVIRDLLTDGDSYRPGEPTYKCLLCRDRGVVEVFHPKAYKPIRKETFNKNLHTGGIVVACHCQSGKQHCEKDQGDINSKKCLPNLIMFDHNRMLATDGHGHVDLINFVENDYRPKNFNFEFDEFS